MSASGEQQFHRDVVLLHARPGSPEWAVDIPKRLGHLHDCLLLVLRDADFSRAYLRVECIWASDGYARRLCDAKLIVRGPEVGQLEALLGHRPFFTFDELSGQVRLAALFIGSRRHYRELLDLASDQQLVKRLLMRSNELAALQAFAISSQVLRAVRTDPAYSAIVSTDEEQFALLSLKQIFDRDLRLFPRNIDQIEAAFEIAPEKLLHVRLAYEMALESLQPATVIIGPNGVGKTRLLLGLGKAAVCRRGTTLSVREQGEVTTNNSLALVAFTYERALWRGLANSGAQIVSLGVSASNWRGFAGVLRTLALDQERAEFNLPALFLVMAEVANLDHVYLPTLVKTELDAGHTQPSIPLSRLRNFAELNVVSALDLGKDAYFWSVETGNYRISSGQKSVLLFAANLFQKTARGAFVLIDEPENHLHPRFVSILMQMLQRVLIATESRAVVVTHSPYVVREVDKTAVLIMQNDTDGNPALYRTSMQTLGADVSSISDHVFRDVDTRKSYERLIDALLDQARDDQDRQRIIKKVEASVGRDAELYIHLKTNRRPGT